MLEFISVREYGNDLGRKKPSERTSIEQLSISWGYGMDIRGMNATGGFQMFFVRDRRSKFCRKPMSCRPFPLIEKLGCITISAANQKIEAKLKKYKINCWMGKTFVKNLNLALQKPSISWIVSILACAPEKSLNPVFRLKSSELDSKHSRGSNKFYRSMISPPIVTHNLKLWPLQL